VVAVDAAGRYVGLALVAEAHAPDIERQAALSASFITGMSCCTLS